MQPATFLLRSARCATLLLCSQFVLTCNGQPATMKPRAATTTMQQPAMARAAAIADTSPARKAFIDRRLTINSGLYTRPGRLSSVDTVLNIDPYLQGNEGCDIEKSATPDGCVLVKYKNGFIKKICNGKVTEVTTPDGKKHVQRAMNTAYMYVMGVPPPPNPGTQSNSYQWLSKYNDGLLQDILLFLGNQQSMIDQYNQNEDAKCQGNIYKQIEYRTIFIETFLEAK